MATGDLMTSGDLMTGPALWFANRGTGFVLLVLLTLSTMLGVLSTARVSPKLWPRMLSQGLHRNISLLAVTFLGAHVVTAVVDTYVDIRWWHALVPFAGTYKPLWLGLGTFSLDLLIAVTLTSVLRHRMTHRPWRAVHVLAYGAWGLGLLHGLQIGTDAGTPWGNALNYGCVLAVGLAVVVRLGLLVRPRLVTT